MNSLPSLFEFNTSFWEEEISQGESTSWGIEIENRFKLKDKVSVFASYTFSNTDYQFESINDGNPFPFSFDIPHKINLAASYQFRRNLRLSIDWVFSSGRPISFYSIDGDFSILDNLGSYDSMRISDINSIRLTDQHKLSISMTKVWKSKNIDQSLSLGIHNIYNRKNELFQYLDFGLGLQQQNGFPISPVLRYQVSL